MSGGVIGRSDFIISPANYYIILYNDTSERTALIISHTILRKSNCFAHKFFFPGHNNKIQQVNIIITRCLEEGIEKNSNLVWAQNQFSGIISNLFIKCR